MTSVRRKVQQLTADSRVRRWEIWCEEDDEPGMFTSDAAPGVRMTLAELEARDGPPDLGQILICYEDTPPPERTP